MDDTWEFRYVIDHVPAPGKPQWTEWLQVQETGSAGSGKWPQGYRVDALSGSAVVQFRRAPVKCEAWINLCSLTEELRPLTSVCVYCDVPAGEDHLADVDGEPLHRYRAIYWGARSVPEEGE